MGPDYSQLLGSPQVAQQQPTAPTAQMPGGGVQEPQDPTSYASATMAQGLSRLADEYAQIGDETNSLKVQKMALELKRIRADRQKKLSQGFKDVQSTILPQMM